MKVTAHIWYLKTKILELEVMPQRPLCVCARLFLLFINLAEKKTPGAPSSGCNISNVGLISGPYVHHWCARTAQSYDP